MGETRHQVHWTARAGAGKAGGRDAGLRRGMDGRGWSCYRRKLLDGFIVTPENALVTRPLSRSILPGVTRMSLLRLAEERKLAIEERPFSVEEAYAAKEAFFTSASSLVTPVVAIDGRLIGDGTPGSHTTRLRELYLRFARETSGE